MYYSKKNSVAYSKISVTYIRNSVTYIRNSVESKMYDLLKEQYALQ